MGIEWFYTTVEDFSPLSYGKALVECDRNSLGCVPVFASSGLVGWHDLSITSSASVIIGRKGNVGSVYFSETPCWPIDTVFFVSGLDVELMRYKFYVIKSLKLNLMAGDSAVPGLSRKDVHCIDLRVHANENEQRAIAHILGTLDDKIELNRKMNATLEAMARALFKSWFVDFDPVRAKMEGRDTGLPKEIADLFPDRLVESELGWIPEGWRWGCVADYAFLNPESWNKNNCPDEVFYVDLSNVKWGRIEAVKKYLSSDAPSRAKRVLRKGDTIFGTVRPGNGSYALISQDGLTGSTGFAVLRPNVAYFVEFVYLSLTSSDVIGFLSGLADGGAYPAVKPNVVFETRVISPPDEILEEFSKKLEAVFTKMRCNEEQSWVLSELRDTLLPKLISGELRVKDVEGVVARAT